MKIGYARVSTDEQSLDLQLDALKQAGCEKIYQETASGAQSERPQLEELLRHLRKGDVLVIWKLDRLGRSLKHLVTLTSELMEQGVGLQSISDPIDTTTPHGRLTFNLFASLAEFERDLIRERTQAGLKAARARGRKGGRPTGLSHRAQATAAAAETLYRKGEHSTRAIAKMLGISKSTLYAYLRHREVEIGSYRKKPKVMKVEVWLRVERNNKYVRGKQKAKEEIERCVFSRYQMEKPKPDGWDYVLSIPYQTDEELDRIIYDDILGEAQRIAESRHCFIEADVRSIEDPDRQW
jgi:DNA invertase Pin-like site-specific DNA recombinase